MNFTKWFEELEEGTKWIVGIPLTILGVGLVGLFLVKLATLLFE